MAALEIFVCSSSREEADYRIRLLECVSRVFSNPIFHATVLAWVEALNKVIYHPLSVSLQFHGKLLACLLC